MSIENDVGNEVQYGVIPTLKKDRIYGFWDTVLVTGGYAIATWCYVQGGYLAGMLGFKQVIASTFFVCILTGLIGFLVVKIPDRHGVDIWFYQRAVFGNKAMIILWMIALASTWGYSAINAQLYANSIIKIFQAGGVELGQEWVPWIGMTCIGFGCWVAYKGPVAVRLATRIMVPCLLAVGTIIMILVFKHSSLSELAAITPVWASSYPDKITPYMLGVEWNIAFVFAWYPVLGVIPRFCKSERSAYWAHIIGYAGIMAWFICIGALTGLLMSSQTGAASTDPTEWLIELGGPVLGLLSLVFIGIANITTQGIGLYSLTVSSKVVKPDLSYNKMILFWSGYCTLLLFWGGIWDYYTTFLSVIGVICGPAVSLIIVDYFLVRKQRFSMAGIFKLSKTNVYEYSKGFNMPAVIAFLCGVGAYYYVYDPINFVPKSKIFLYTSATGFASIVSSAVYIGLYKTAVVRKYLLRDAEYMSEDLDATHLVEKKYSDAA